MLDPRPYPIAIFNKILSTLLFVGYLGAAQSQIYGQFVSSLDFTFYVEQERSLFVSIPTSQSQLTGNASRLSMRLCLLCFRAQ